MSWTSYQIRKIVGCACAGNTWNAFHCHRLQRKLLLSDPGMYHGTCVLHVPWCMTGSPTRSGGENVTGIPGECATRNLTYLARGPWLLCDATWGPWLCINISWHCFTGRLNIMYISYLYIILHITCIRTAPCLWFCFVMVLHRSSSLIPYWLHSCHWWIAQGSVKQW